ncbi:DUF1800 domain-containing protein [Ideonella paludis]|uniref:DUF1800 domain-containing protein n=1 Tax=Ideonella paludis TaxID=1233411 RepID=A0ABS5DYX5_9BURK|nr:DUF1800 domain-containing protein [Ideonella paludis]MBQ0936355.1 DUF1800 domain-containing protein [Ideonella paludis]
MSEAHLTRRSALRWALASAAGGWLPWGAVSAQAQASVPTPAATAMALHLSQRLGYGPVPGQLRHVSQQGWQAYVNEQLEPQRLPLPAELSSALAGLKTLSWSQTELIEQYRRFTKEARVAKQQDEAKGNPQRAQLARQVGLEAGEARVLRALYSPRQLEEVLVEFWFNHFNVFIGKGLCRVLMGSYEQQAIRPFVLGRFRDMLGATAKHPAMLFYLDNWMSVGTGTPGARAAGDQPKKPSGLNENYARELMELHTLGVDGGYTQRDVTELARIFTGWGLNMRPDGDDSAFQFAPRRHDPGEKEWLGRRIKPQGQAEGELALDVLAKHPSTARHISRKLAQYFVADEPPASLVDKLAARFTQTDGDLKVVTRTLLESPEFAAPSAQGNKFKPPYRYLLSALRAADTQNIQVRPLVAVLQRLGMPLFGSPTPDGYKYTERAWLSPDALQSRVSFATAFAAGRLPGAQRDDDEPGMNEMRDMSDKPRKNAKPEQGEKRPKDNQAEARMAQRRWEEVDADALLKTLGPAIGPKTRAVVEQSEPALRAALILGSPDFMRY